MVSDAVVSASIAQRVPVRKSICPVSPASASHAA